MELDLGFVKADLLDALPHHRGIFTDLIGLGAEGSALAGAWLEEMLNGGQAVFSFSPGDMLESLLSMHTSARNVLKRSGVPPMGLGFPFVLMKTPQRTIATPLLIWPVVMEPEAVGLYKWYLGLRENKPVSINYTACALVQECTGFDLLSRLRALGDRPGWPALRDVLNELTNDFIPEGMLELRPCPGIETLGLAASSPKICSCAVIGLLPLEQVPLPAAGISRDSANSPNAWGGHPFGYGALDPYQAMAAEGLRGHQDVVINGGPGTGKNYMARHLITNFLSNGRPCLVVADTLPPLRELQQSLADMGLGRLCFTFCNPREDFQVLRDFMRTEIFQERALTAFDFKKFRLDTDKLVRIKEKLDKAYGATHVPLLGADAWTNLVGKYLMSSQHQGKELLGPYLVAADYRFEQEEFDGLLQAVVEALPLFQGIKGIDHPLSRLHPEVFLRYPKAEALERAAHKIPAYEKRVSELLHRYISCLNSYSDQLRTFLEEHCRKLTIQTGVAIDLIRDYALEFGDTFQASGDTSLRISSVFSRNGKKIMAARAEIRQIHLALSTSAAALEEFGLDNKPLMQARSFSDLVDGLNSFQERLKQWALELPDFVQAETTRMCASQLHTMVMPETIPAGLEEEMEVLLQEMNEEKLLHDPLEHRFLTLSKRGKYLEQIVQDLEALRVGLRDFPGFYDWQRFWLRLPGNARKLIRALTIIKPQDWPAAFRSWYLDQVLLKGQDIALPQETPPLDSFYTRWADLQGQLPTQISALWDMRRAALQKEARTNREFSNWLSGKGKRGRAEKEPVEVFADFSTFYTEVFPLTLATGKAATEILHKAAPGYFECVIALEGQKMPVDLWRQLVQYGRRSALMGDFGREGQTRWQIGEPVFELGVAHCRNLLNPFLPLPSEVFPPKGEISTVVALEGVYDEVREINIAECEFVLDYLLYQLPQQHGALLPSVSVVAFTLAQRDAIASRLMQQKFSPGPEGDRIRQLERAGLTVLALGELEELRSDVVLVSVVFNAWPSVLWGKYNQIGGTFSNRMRRLLTMARREMIFCHTVPPEVLQQWQGSPVTTPEGFLGNYLIAANGEAAEQARARLSSLRPEPTRGLSRSAFWEALEERIRPFFPADRVRKRMEDSQIPSTLEIIPENPQSPNVLLIADGFLGTLPRTDYAWEVEFGKILQQKGFQARQVWSVNWWKQPGQEARRLAGTLLLPEVPSSE
jgi:hypothetical protein